MSKEIECMCAYCKNDIDFSFDDFLLDEISAGNVVVFAGAGVSTENPLSAPHTLYTELAVELGLKDRRLPFPDLAQKYVQRPDGWFKLARRIQDRFDYINKFRDLRNQSTKFFYELSTMPYLNVYVTTNWDRNFEEICHAKPFVYDTDMRFWEVPDRKVLKIHGTIDDYSSIIATRDDYVKCEEDLHRSLKGAKLKEILTTKTCIFVGYSMRDDDFQEIFSFVRSALGKFEKTHYFVSPSADSSEPIDNIIRVKTDGTFFFKNIKQHMCFNGCFIDDSVFEHISDELSELIEEHVELWERFDAKELPQILVPAVYQDGLIHGYQLIIDAMGTGRFSDAHLIQSTIISYEDKIKHYRSRRAYFDVAYFRGYQNALLSLVLSKKYNEFSPAPIYYFEGIGEMDSDEFNERLDSLPDIHKSAFRLCEKAVAKFPDGESYVYQHMPWG